MPQCTRDQSLTYAVAHTPPSSRRQAVAVLREDINGPWTVTGGRRQAPALPLPAPHLTLERGCLVASHPLLLLGHEAVKVNPPALGHAGEWLAWLAGAEVEAPGAGGEERAKAPQSELGRWWRKRFYLRDGTGCGASGRARPAALKF